MKNAVTHVVVVREDGSQAQIDGDCLVLAPAIYGDTVDQIALREVLRYLAPLSPDQAARVVAWADDVTQKRRAAKAEGAP